MNITSEEIKLVIELLAVEASKHAAKGNGYLAEKYDTVKQKLNMMLKSGGI